MHLKYGKYYGAVIKMLSMNRINSLNVSIRLFLNITIPNNSGFFIYYYLRCSYLNQNQNTKLLKMIIILTNNGQCKVIHQDSSACSWRSVDIFQLYNILSVYINLNKIASLSASIAWKTNIIFTNCSFDNIKTTMSIVMHSFWN